MKRILVYIGHPAQYHFVKYSVAQWRQNGDEVKILIKTKDILEDLLKQDGLAYENIQILPRSNSKIAMLKASLRRTKAVLGIAKSFKADVLVGTDSSIAQAAWLLHKPAITVLEDDYEVIRNLAKLTFPFTSCILVPSICDVGPYEQKKVGYSGYMKLAYLHPNRFEPNRTIFDKYCLAERYVLIRLAKLVAYHDSGINGLNLDLVNEVITCVKRYGYKVYITSEVELIPPLSSYQLHIDYKDIHHILAFSSLLVSDSQSMSVEAAMLGTPSIRFNDFAGKISVLEELEHKYHLTYAIRSNEPERLYAKVEELLSIPNLKETYQLRKNEMLSEKIDVTAFFTWFVENYPKSNALMHRNPEYQRNF